MKSSKNIAAKDITVIALAVALIEVGKLVLQGVPNVELTSFFVIMFTLVLGWKMIFVIPIFILIEGTVYGFGLWWIMYLYSWPLLCGITYLFRKTDSVWLYSIMSALFGLFFGALCSVPYFFIGGTAMAFNWWIAGIPFDITHCIGNFFVMMLLYKPVRRALNKIYKDYSAQS